MNHVPAFRRETTAPRDVPDETAALYHFLVESLTEYAVFAVSPSGGIVSWNSGAQATFGYTEAEIVGKNFALIFTPEDIAAEEPAAELATALSGSRANHDRWHVRKDGTRFWGTNTVQPMFDSSGELFGFAKLVRDATANYLALAALSDSEQRQRMLIESVPEFAIFSVALDATITSWSVGAQATFGYAENEIVGRPLATLYTADDVSAGVPAREIRVAAEHGQSADERWLVRRNSSRFLASNMLGQLKRGANGELRGFVKVAHDITERKRLADDLRRRALSDSLTKLPNRGAFFEHVKRAIASMKRRPANLFAVLFVDLDHFKTVNDTYGHVVADKLLEATARRLESCVRSGDVIARLGGDEFAILLNGIDDVTHAIDAGERIGVEISPPMQIDDYAVRVTASVGIALGSVSYQTPEDIVADADAAMYAAKTRGRSRAVLFDPTMIAHQDETRDIDTALRQALDRNELRVVYQPIIALPGRAVVGCEALVRWEHPRRGILQPAEFIGVAETSEAIVAIDRWVFRTACADLAGWQRTGLAPPAFQLSVNFSRKQFTHSELPQIVGDTLREAGIDPNRVRLEITESGAIEHSAATAALMAQVRALGVELAIDDFGIGYSSIESLRHMPVAALKIDRSFVAGMNAPTGAGLVGSIIALAHNLGLTVVAEGVETPEQLAGLENFGCDFAQGFLFSQPRAASAAGEMFATPG